MLLLLPAALALFGALVESNRSILLFVALGLNFTTLAPLSNALPVPGGARVYPADVLVLLAVGAWLAARLTRPEDQAPRSLKTPVLGLPFLLLSVTILLGVVRGHERYGASLVAVPFRLLLYAGIAFAICDLTPRQAFRGIVIVFYAGTVFQFFMALYGFATGTSTTDSDALSTGGVRVLGLTGAMYLACALILALLNLELAERAAAPRIGHALIAALAAFGIIVALGRTTFAAVGVIIPLLFLGLRHMRKTLLSLLPLGLPLLAAFAVAIPHVAPDSLPTFRDRIVAAPTNDESVKWRENAYRVSLEGVSDAPINGVGFGRSETFTLNNQQIRIQGDPHNSYVFLLAGGGALALGSYLLLMLVFVVDSTVRARRARGVERALVVWAIASWFVFTVNAATGPVLSDPIALLTIWSLMLLPALVGRSAPEAPAAAAMRPRRLRTREATIEAAMARAAGATLARAGDPPLDADLAQWIPSRDTLRR
jgi:O-antigen ligase